MQDPRRRSQRKGLRSRPAPLAVIGSLAATITAQIALAAPGSVPATESGPLRLAGTDILRILPPNPSSGSITPMLNPPPLPLPTPPAPGPNLTIPSPAPGPRPGTASGQFLMLQVRVGSLPTDPSKGAIGVKLDPIEPALAASAGLMSASGALVIDVTAGGAAAQGGTRVGDIVVSFNGAPVSNVNEFRQRMSQTAPGSSATVEVWRFLAEERDLLPTLRRLGDEGNAGVMHRLGLMYANGNGVPRDDFEAVRWYRKGVDAGYAPAAAVLAFMTLEGRGTDKSPQEATRLYRMAADAGDLDSMWRLGKILAEGKVVARDDAEALRWFRSGATAGNAMATSWLAYMTLEGRGTDKNPQEAMRLYRVAADAGNLDSAWRLGKFLLEGKVVPKDAAQAAQLFLKAAEAGHTPSMVDLGIMYDQANGLPQNYPEAARWYKRAADLGNASGMANLGILYKNGRGIGQSDTAAVELYRKAADLGNPTAIHNLAAMLDDGRGVGQKDPERAAELVMRSLSMGYEFSFKQMTENTNRWSLDFRRALQRRLKTEGLYSGPIDGVFGQPTTAAITALFNRARR